MTRTALLAATIITMSAAATAQVVDPVGGNNRSAFGAKRDQSASKSGGAQQGGQSNSSGVVQPGQVVGRTSGAFNRNNAASASGRATSPQSTGATNNAVGAAANRLTRTTTRSTTGTATKPGSIPSKAAAGAVPGGQRPPGATAAGATSNAPSGKGQVQEISKGAVEAMKTRKVDYDEAEMSERDGVIILNSRKYEPAREEPKRTSSVRTRRAAGA